MFLGVGEIVALRCPTKRCKSLSKKQEGFHNMLELHIIFFLLFLVGKDHKVDFLFFSHETLQEGYLVYECNQMCSCNRTCPNRVLQNGVRVKLEVFKTEKKVGFFSLQIEMIDKRQILIFDCFQELYWLHCKIAGVGSQGR